MACACAAMVSRYWRGASCPYSKLGYCLFRHDVSPPFVALQHLVSRRSEYSNALCSSSLTCPVSHARARDLGRSEHLCWLASEQ